MNNLYELTLDEVLEWVTSYCDYDDLEKLAKATYSIYVQRRKQEHPDKHIANRKAKRNFNKQKVNTSKKRYPKGYRKYAPPLEQNRAVPYTEIRK